MNRTERQNRSHRLALAIGLVASVLVHAVVFTEARFDFELPADPAPTIGIVDISEPLALRAIPRLRVVDITEVPPIGALATSSSAAPASASPTAIAVSSEALLAARSDNQRTFEPIVFMDPVLDPGTALDFNELVVAEASPSVQPTEGYPLYEPGSVGRAKKTWAQNGAGTGQPRDPVTFAIGMGGGHCPLPGRGGIGPWFGR